MDAEVARAILAQGRKDGTHEQPIPEDDAKAITDAEELVDMAQTAWNQHVRGPEVEVLLRMAADAENGGPPPKGEEPESEQAPVEEETPSPEAQQEEETPPSPEDPGDVDLLDVEPWENYNNESVAMVISGINSGQNEMSPNEFRDLMSHVWAYEQEHKNRATVLDHLERTAKKLNQAAEEAPEETPEETPEEPSQPSQEAETPAETPPEEPEEPEKQPGIEPAEVDPTAPGVDPDPPPIEAPEKQQIDLGERKKEEPPPEQQDEEVDYVELVRMIESDLQEERLHKPEPPAEKIPDLPWDWTKMTDGDLQRFHGQFSVLAYYKNYVLAREERIALACKMAADELHTELMVALPKYDERDKEKRVALIEAEVESDENIRKWRRRQRKHETFASAHRYERDSFARIVEALSRHETMRHDEWERSGKLGSRRQ